MQVNGMSNNFIVPANSISGILPVSEYSAVGSSSKVKGVTECTTCENRMYVDGSNESDVSFKAPGHISPEQSYAKVMSHEQEHVSNARAKGSKPDTQLMSATVSLKMATCPECGRRYVAGGLTKAAIKYTEKSPYDNGRKIIEGSFLKGMNVDKTV